MSRIALLLLMIAVTGTARADLDPQEVSAEANATLAGTPNCSIDRLPRQYTAATRRCTGANADLYSGVCGSNRSQNDGTGVADFRAGRTATAALRDQVNTGLNEKFDAMADEVLAQGSDQLLRGDTNLRMPGISVGPGGRIERNGMQESGFDPIGLCAQTAVNSCSEMGNARFDIGLGGSARIPPAHRTVALRCIRQRCRQEVVEELKKSYDDYDATAPRRQRWNGSAWVGSGDPINNALRAHQAEIDRDITSRVMQPDKVARAGRVFEEVKARITSLLRARGAPQAYIDRVQNTTFQVAQAPSDPTRGNTRLTKAELLDEVNADYSAGTQHPYGTMRVTGPFLHGFTSENAMAAVFAHELGHSIDPCMLTLRGQDTAPLAAIDTCLRATHATMTPHQDNQHTTPTDANHCDTAHDDSIGEAQADWLSSQIVPGFIADRLGPNPPAGRRTAAIQNSLKIFCTQGPVTTWQNSGGACMLVSGAHSPGAHPEEDPHPAPFIRINRVFGASPNMTSLLGCYPRDSECSLGRSSTDGGYTPPTQPHKFCAPQFGAATATP